MTTLGLSLTLPRDPDAITTNGMITTLNTSVRHASTLPPFRLRG